MSLFQTRDVDNTSPLITNPLPTPHTQTNKNKVGLKKAFQTDINQRPIIAIYGLNYHGKNISLAMANPFPPDNKPSPPPQKQTHKNKVNLQKSSSNKI